MTQRLFFLLIAFLLSTPALAETTSNNRTSRVPVVTDDQEEGGTLSSRTSARSGGKSVGSAPIYSSFSAQFARCLPGCTPSQVGTWGSRGGRSCHPGGKAVDVGAVKCGSRLTKAINDSPSKKGKVDQLARCFKAAGWTVLWHKCASNTSTRNATTCHKDHVHLSKCCTVNGKRAC